MSDEQKPVDSGTSESTPSAPASESHVSYQQTVDDPYGYGYDPYATTDTATASNVPVKAEPVSPPPPAPPTTPAGEEEDEEDEGMLRMSFLEHLEELRSRLIKALAGLGVAFVVSMYFANDLWRVVSNPAAEALKSLGFDPNLAQITPMDAFTTIWVKVPLLTSLFLASPWVLYQVWAFIAPGLYKKERRWAAPFVIISAGLFITGGLFAYFVAFRFGLKFLLGIGKDINVRPVVSLVEYFDLFVNVTLGIGLLFELPVLIFFLTLLRMVTPGFLIRNSRYAILIITILAAIITPTPDVVNLTIFAVPMILLYFVGIFAGWFLVLHREGRKGTIRTIYLSAIGVALLAGAAVAVAVLKFGYHFTSQWPFLVR
jgi:sec-independent protein translocase protein TatC